MRSSQSYASTCKRVTCIHGGLRGVAKLAGTEGYASVRIRVPPVGTKNCTMKQVYNEQTKKYEWKSTCK